MFFQKKYTIIISILAILLLLSYYYFYSVQLWGGIKGNLLKIYYLSITLSFIGFLFLFYYLFTSNKLTYENSLNIFYSLLGIVIFSMFWMPLSLYYLKNKSTLLMFLIISLLLLVSLSAFYLLINIYKINDNSLSKKLAVGGVIIFFIHVFILDNISWSILFF